MPVPNQSDWRARVRKQHEDGVINFLKVGALAPPVVIGRPVPQRVIQQQSNEPKYVPQAPPAPVVLPPLPPPTAEEPIAAPPQRKRTI